MTSGRTQTKIVEVTSYPPPRAGWGVRVEFVKKRLESQGHRCVVLNIGQSRAIPSVEYETVLGGRDFLKKIWRFSRAGYVVHAHANGDALKGLLLALVAEAVNLSGGRRPFLTFHAGAIQRYFPRDRAMWLIPAFWLLFMLPRRIICNSDAVKACIAGYGIPTRKIVPIPAFSREYLEYTPVALPREIHDFLDQFPHVVFSYVRMRSLFYPLTLATGMELLMRRRSDVGLIVVGGTGHADEGLWPAFQAEIDRAGIGDRILFVDDLDHDAFLTVLGRATLYLRTPITDGVASSVSEALALGTPVVACDNGTRPRSVVTYSADDPEQLAAAIEHVLANRAEIIASIDRHEIADTVADEAALLTS